MNISVIIPVYNEASNILPLHSRLREVLVNLTGNYELIFVNDGSTDTSLSLIRELARQEPRVKYIDFSRNFGHQVAVSAGIDKAQGQAVIIMDGDLQDPPELIKDLYARWQAGYEVVYTKRRARNGESAAKKITARYFYRLLARITHISIPLDAGDFRIISRKVADALKQMPEKHKFIRGQISWIGFSQTYLEYDRPERAGGESSYTYRKMIRLALDAITSFSNLPLKIATISGFLVSGVAFLLMLYTLYSRFVIKDYVPGWSSLMLSVLFLGGVQLISIGIIGEYISRLSDNVRNRPLYIINDTNITG
ncbi:glycosyltransferase family 2 protein [Adhaeribacter rhizoryzae]|uniref:Glycosyltransferase family 2 protein n=1 Tax=Adhaeribacter rhizoryzae TaxID=2607907 RepID=A0A5M6D8U5_9BACT|nr:glycosyltransferase family 2 protein [Adhaeribacter rhizoryzae]KAA5543954.1 glycosyltransferase family 2 protein [Adhaeribacter rhizoryzae]